VVSTIKSKFVGKEKFEKVERKQVVPGETEYLTENQDLYYKEGLERRVFLRPLINGQKYTQDDTTTRITYYKWSFGNKGHTLVMANTITKKDKEPDVLKSYRYYYSENEFFERYGQAWQSNKLPIVEDDKTLIDLQSADAMKIRCLFTDTSNDGLKVVQDTDALFELTKDRQTILLAGVAARGFHIPNPTTDDYTEPTETRIYGDFFKDNRSVGFVGVNNLITVQARGGDLHPKFTNIVSTKTPVGEDFTAIEGKQLFSIPFTRFLKIVKKKKGRFKMIYRDSIDERPVLFDDLIYNMTLADDEGKEKYKLEDILVNRNNGTGKRIYAYLGSGKGIRIYKSRTEPNQYSIENNLHLRLGKRKPPKERIAWDNLPAQCYAKAITRTDVQRNKYGGTLKKFPSNHIFPFLIMAQSKLKTNPNKPIGLLLMHKDRKIAVYFENNIWYYTTKQGYSTMFVQQDISDMGKLLDFTEELMKEIGTYEQSHTSWNTVQGIVYANHTPDGQTHISSNNVYTAQNLFQRGRSIGVELDDCSDEVGHTFKAEMFRHQVGETRLYMCPVDTVTKTESRKDADDNLTTLSQQVIRQIGLDEDSIRRRIGPIRSDYTTSKCWFCGTDPCLKRTIKRSLREQGIL